MKRSKNCPSPPTMLHVRLVESASLRTLGAATAAMSLRAEYRSRPARSPGLLPRGLQPELLVLDDPRRRASFMASAFSAQTRRPQRPASSRIAAASASPTASRWPPRLPGLMRTVGHAGLLLRPWPRASSLVAASRSPRLLPLLFVRRQRSASAITCTLARPFSFCAGRPRPPSCPWMTFALAAVPVLLQRDGVGLT